MTQYNNPEAAQQAAELLHRIDNNTELLCHVAEREHLALLERDTLQLESIAADKKSLVAKLQSQHQAICQLLQVSEAQLPDTLATLGLDQQWQTNKLRLQEARAKNDRNGILLNSVVARVQKELSLLTGQTTLSYKNEGSANVHRDMGTLGRA